jgi:hypothetical protein
MKKFTNDQMNTLKQLMSYSDRYEINIQFWPIQISVFIGKDDVDLTSFGGDFGSIECALQYLKRINRDEITQRRNRVLPKNKANVA